jgi:hypothetical protein
LFTTVRRLLPTSFGAAFAHVRSQLRYGYCPPKRLVRRPLPTYSKLDFVPSRIDKQVFFQTMSPFIACMIRSHDIRHKHDIVVVRDCRDAIYGQKQDTLLLDHQNKKRVCPYLFGRVDDTKRSGVSRSQLRRPVCTRESSGRDGVSGCSHVRHLKGCLLWVASPDQASRARTASRVRAYFPDGQDRVQVRSGNAAMYLK